MKKIIILIACSLCFSIAACNINNRSLAENPKTASDNVSVESTKSETTENAEPIVNLTQEIVELKIGDLGLQAVVSKGKPDKPLYFNMHDDENTSVQAAKSVADKQGGKVIELKHTGARLINFKLNNKPYTIDPNRIYTTLGINKTLLKNGKTSPEAEAEVDKFAKKLIADFLKQTDVVIALHNNSNNEYSAKSYEKGGEFEKDAAQVFINPQNDIDDFFFVTEEKYFNKLKEKGYNVILQDNNNVTDDGSLSVYCGKEKIKYINVEAEHGHLAQQIKMLETLREVLAD
ncbi:MAG TPA: hypothetical protein PKY59_23710 [Pyrinomonadaceae bacterium]|nr:hypothetical protein [Pyrinomonadaceae bacterium]